MNIEKFSVGPFETNCYILISDSDRAIIVDPGAESEKIKRFLKTNRISASFILHTHGHIDHIGADNDLGLAVYIHKEDARLLKDPDLNLSRLFFQPFIVENEIVCFETERILNLDQITLKVIHTPGHTPGSSCFLISDQKQDILFSGDTLFYLGVGRTDFLGASYDELIKSVKEKLFILDDDTLVYPGHGPLTYIGKEKRSNPFLK